MLKPLLSVRVAALLAGFSGRNRQQRKQTRGRAALMGLLMVYCAACFLILFYSSFSQLAAAFFPSGLGWLYFAMLAVMAFALMFVGSVFTAKSQLFEAKDNELLLAMPVKPGDILLSRMASLLLLNLVFELVVALPAALAWVQYGAPSAFGVVAFALLLLALPMFAAAISCLFAWLLSLLTSRMRSTTAVTMVLSVAFMLLYMVGCFRLNSYVAQLAASGTQIAGSLRAVLPLYWLGMCVADGQVWQLAVTLVWLLAPFALAYVLLSRGFIRIVTTKRGSVRIRYEKKRMQAASADTALYRRELARLTSSAGYMLNAGLGLVFELALAVLLVVKRQSVAELLNQMAFLRQAAAPAALLVGMMMSGMVFFTAASVSLEGAGYWIVRAMPVQTRQVLRAKQRLSASLCLLPGLLLTASMIAVLQLPAAAAALLAACQFLFILLAGNVGLMEDLRHANLHWVNETQAVKQGMGSLLTMLILWGLTLAVGAIYFAVLASRMTQTAFLAAVLVLLGGLYVLSERWLAVHGTRRFEQLS